MTRNPILYMDPYVCRNRQQDIRAYCKWIEERLFPCIGTWEEEENRATQDFEKGASSFFDGEFSDPASYYEDGYEYIISECLKIAEVNGYMIGVGITGLYHLWEKQVLSHLAKELKTEWKIKDKDLPWRWTQILDVFKSYSTDLRELHFYQALNELRLFTNAIKHGEGSAFKQLRKLNSDILRPYHHSEDQPVASGTYALLRADIYPRKEHFFKCKEAVLSFWDFEFWHDRGEHLPFDQWISGSSKR